MVVRSLLKEAADVLKIEVYCGVIFPQPEKFPGDYIKLRTSKN